MGPTDTMVMGEGQVGVDLIVPSIDDVPDSLALAWRLAAGGTSRQLLPMAAGRERRFRSDGLVVHCFLALTHLAQAASLSR